MTGIGRFLADRWQQSVGSLLLIFGVVTTVVLGFLATKSDSVPAVLGIIAAVAQFAASLLFSQVRKPTPAHAKTIVRKMYSLSDRLIGMVKDIEATQEKEPAATPTEIRKLMNIVNVQASTLAEDSVTLIESWRDFDKETVRSFDRDVQSNELFSNADDPNSADDGEGGR